MKTIFCHRCLYSSDHPLGIVFDDQNICSGCKIHEEKNKLDWGNRWNKLKKIISPYKSRKNNYDCIVPVTGAQDSFFIMHLVKKLKLRPLGVCYNKYFNSKTGIENLANLRNIFDLDILFQNVNPITVKKITKKTLSDFGNMYWPILAGHSVFPIQISIKYQIPLIIWGAHQGLEQVGMFSHLNEVEMTRRYRKEHDLFGYEAENLINNNDNLLEEDIFQYLYPEDSALNKNGTRGIYLGNYVPWDPKLQHEQMIKLYNYKTFKFNRTIDCYDYVDCQNYMNLHDQLKLYKHGYSKITDHLTREIRFNRIDRVTALKLAMYYENKKISNLNTFCEWLGVNEKSLIFILNSFKNKKFWHQTNINQWKFNGLSILNKEYSKNNKIYKKKIKKIKFIANNKNNFSEEYITFGKGIN
jgi:N-acetyl sugar amidotransferase